MEYTNVYFYQVNIILTHTIIIIVKLDILHVNVKTNIVLYKNEIKKKKYYITYDGEL